MASESSIYENHDLIRKNYQISRLQTTLAETQTTLATIQAAAAATARERDEAWSQARQSLVQRQQLHDRLLAVTRECDEVRAQERLSLDQRQQLHTQLLVVTQQREQFKWERDEFERERVTVIHKHDELRKEVEYWKQLTLRGGHIARPPTNSAQHGQMEDDPYAP